MNDRGKDITVSCENTNKGTRSNWGQVMEGFLREPMFQFRFEMMIAVAQTVLRLDGRERNRVAINGILPCNQFLGLCVDERWPAIRANNSECVSGGKKKEAGH